jgi:hypothetical protein
VQHGIGAHGTAQRYSGGNVFQWQCCLAPSLGRMTKFFGKLKNALKRHKST